MVSDGSWDKAVKENFGPAEYKNDAFVAMRGSWNRNPPSGYKVVFVPFRGGRPSGQAIDFVTGFMGEDGKTRGRPVGGADRGVLGQPRRGARRRPADTRGVGGVRRSPQAPS